MIALHGFLGLPSDWDFLKPHFNFQAAAIVEENSLHAWAKNFNQSVNEQMKKPILIGYSLGGRLALEAAKQNPSLYKSLILISTHPGLLTEQEKKERLSHDQKWSLIFQDTPWELLMEKWEAQELFKTSRFRLQRHEKNYQRRVLMTYLQIFSLGHQTRELPKIPILWITGQEDQKFTQLAKEVAQEHSFSTHRIMEGSHRCLFEFPEKFIQVLKSENFF